MHNPLLTGVGQGLFWTHRVIAIVNAPARPSLLAHHMPAVTAPAEAHSYSRRDYPFYPSSYTFVVPTEDCPCRNGLASTGWLMPFDVVEVLTIANKFFSSTFSEQTNTPNLLLPCRDLRPK